LLNAGQPELNQAFGVEKIRNPNAGRSVCLGPIRNKPEFSKFKFLKLFCFEHLGLGYLDCFEIRIDPKGMLRPCFGFEFVDE
jgi:hypothetical protein